MRNLIFFFVFFLLTCSSAVAENVVSPPPLHDEVYYRFEKALVLPNRYYLTVVNHSHKSVAFFTQGSSNFLTLDDGKVVPIARPTGSLEAVDKGVVWINPGTKENLSFDIPKEEMRQAATITFKGQTAVAKKEGDAWVVTPDRELFVTYDVRTTEISVKDGAKVVMDLKGAKIEYSVLNGPLAPVDTEQFKMHSQVNFDPQ